MTAWRPPDVTDPSATFGEMLRHFRVRAGLSQEALAERAGISGAAISALEHGLRRSPYAHTVTALAGGLGLSAEEAAVLTRLARRPHPTPHELGSPPEPALAPPLPKPLTRLVGREIEVGEVRQLVEAAPLVTLVGPGGIGKTRLALEVGSQAAGAFRDGVWLADLSPIDSPTLVASTVAAAVGVREQAHTPLLGTLSDALRTRHTLLLLDNCEHLIAACAAWSSCC